MKIKNAIITGPTGAVGVALINELINNNIKIYAVCRPNSKRINNLPKSKLVQVVECAMSDYSSLPSLINDKVDVFYHFAWDGTYGASRNDEYLQNNNILYSIDSVNVAKELGCKVYVGAGSQSEYGCTDSMKYVTDNCNPNNFYGAAKLSASYMTRVLCEKYNIRHNWCRIFSLFGPCDGDYTMIMSSVKKMLNNEECNFTKGEQIWDYIYSKDAAKAFRLVAETGKNGSIYNIASGETRLLKDYILSMHNIVNSKCKINMGSIPYYEHQPMNLTACIDNLKEDTGFNPSYTFELGIEDLIKNLK